MTTLSSENESVQTLTIRKELEIAAPLEISFQAVLDELGPEGMMPDGTPMPRKLEAWPGGRWYRDLGNNTGHFWGHVQVIKPPTLLEISGPLFMSTPAVNHVQYRLKAEGDRTKLSFVHRCVGLILPEHREGAPKGWEFMLGRAREIAERKAKGKSGGKETGR
jgi:uncharacterized protein YndB with AHSA1/START domain